MPVAPQYQPGQVASPRGGGEQFRAARDGANWGEAAAEGLARLGQSAVNYAEAEDAIQQTYDDTQARKMALDYRKEAAPILAELSTLKGENAVNAAPEFRKRLEDLRKTYMGRASNRRMADFLDQRISGAASEYDGKVIDYSTRQMVEMRVSTVKAEKSLAVENAAASYLDPEAAAEYRREALGALSEEATISGWSKELFDLEKRALTSEIHASTLTAMMAEDNADLDIAAAYFEANEDEMTAADRNAALAKLKQPLELRQARGDFFEIASGVTSAPDPDEVGEVVPRQTPVKGTVTNDYGDHLARGSAGYDIAAPAGSSILPTADGIVVDKGYEADRSGHYVIVRHPDDYTTSYSHMQGASSFEIGQPVSRQSVIGTVGSTGRSSGPHLHLRVRDPDGKDVDPEEYMRGSSPVGLPTDARNWDMASIMSAIDEKVESGEWTIERGERAMEYARKRMSDDQALLADRENDADRAASEWVLSKGEGFTDLSQMPAHIRAKLNPSDALKWQGVAERNAEPKETKTVANGPYANMLDLMRFMEPDKFRDINLGEYVGTVTPGEMNTLLQQQAKARNDDKKWSPRTGIVTQFNYQSTLDGKKYAQSDKAAILRLMEDFAYRRREENGGKPLTDRDYADAYRYATEDVNTRVKGLGGLINYRSSEQRYNIDDQLETAEKRERVRQTFLRVYGRRPSENEIEVWLPRLDELEGR